MDFHYDRVAGEATPRHHSMDVSPRLANLLSDRAMQEQVQRGAVPEPQWRSTLRVMCDEARTACVPAEQLLIEIKQALGILCDTCDVPHGSARTEFTSRVVTLCIEEYYAGVARD